MKPIRINPSRSSSATQADSAAPAGSQTGEGFGPILQAASARGAPAPGQSTPPAGRGAQRQPGGTTSGGDGSAAGRDAAAAPPSRRNPSDSQTGTDAAAAAAAAGTASQAVQVVHGAAETATPDGQDAAITGPAADAAAVANAIEAAGAAGLHPSVSAPTLAGGAVPAPAFEAPAGAAGGVAMRALVALTGARAATQAVLPGADEAQTSQAGGGASRTERVTPGPAIRPFEASAPSDDGDGAGASADASSASSAAVVDLSASAVRNGMQALAQEAASAIASTSSKPVDAPPAHADHGAEAIQASDTTGAMAAPTGNTAPATLTYQQDGRVHVATPVDHPEFGQELSQRVVLLARGGVQTAQISLQPADLGPVGVSIQLHGHQAALAFTAAHEATRNALEAALPRLREAFASSGLQLSDATVSGRSHSGWDAPARSRGQGAPWQTGDGAVGAAAIPTSEGAQGGSATTVRLVDIYA